MKDKNERPLYATVFYHVREQLDLTWNEYIYLDMVYHLSKDGWCYKSLDNVAKDMGMVKSGVVKMRDRLIHKNLLKKSIKGYVKTTDMYHSVVRTDSNTYHSVTNRTTQYNAAVPLSSTKNNNENNNRIKEKGSGYLKAREMANKLAQLKAL